ncbi:hypothetical protein V2J09_007432 [Rumex salicifolius]
MSSSIVSPSITLKRVSVNCSESLKGLNCTKIAGFRNGIRSVGLKNSRNLEFVVAIIVGAQAVGMGAEATLFNKANDILGFDLLDICNNRPMEKLDSTILSQPAIYVTSLAAVEILRAREGGQKIIDSVDVTCGLSLGEYTPLAFAGAFSFEDGLKLVKLRGQAIQEATDVAKSAMVSVIGLDTEKVQKLCDAANEDVEEDQKGNYAVSGGVKGIEVLEAKAKSFKA